MRDQPDAVGTHTLRCPRDIIDGRRSPLSSRHQPPTVLTRLLPDATTLRLEACDVDDTTAQITLRVQSTQTSAPCPLCATPARRIHSDYGRTLADLPWAQYRVCLQLRVRKWFCRNRACPPPHLHRTAAHRGRPLGAAHPAARPAPGRPRRGARGARLGCTSATQWDLVVSRNTLLRLLRQAARPVVPHAHACWGWTISPCGNGTPMARSWSIWSAASPWPSSRIAPPRPWRSGSGSIPGWR